MALFIVQRQDCDTFRACADLDPAFASGLNRAADAGVEVLVYRCAMSTESIRILQPMAWKRD